MIALLIAAATPQVPTPAMKQAFEEAVGKQLADPFSAQFDWQPVRNEVLYCGWVNAKNGFGAYAGYRPFMVLYAVNAYSGKARVSETSTNPDIVTPMCLKEGYRLTR